MKTILFILGFLTAVSSDAKTTHAFLKCTTPPDESGAYSKLRITTDQHGKFYGERLIFAKTAPPQKQIAEEVGLTFDSPVTLDETSKDADPRALMMAAIAAIPLKIVPEEGGLEQLAVIGRVKFGSITFANPTHSFGLIEIFGTDSKSLGTVVVEQSGQPAACVQN